MQLTERRDFLKTSAASAAVAGLGLSTARAAKESANGDLRVGLIGCGGRGGQLLQWLAVAKGCQVVALCDADKKAVESKASKWKKVKGNEPAIFTDFRKLLDQQDIDAVVIASPNHWHSLMAIQALQAGKHVYVEKPVCHNIWEGRQMLAAAKKYGKIIAAGFQNRSDKGLREAMPIIHEGKYGKITQARGLCYRARNSIKKLDTPLTPPETVDYNLWLGPAADQPIMRPRFHYDWHWDFNTGNGDMGNQGPHEMDLLQWALGNPKHPQKVKSFGGRFGWDDAGNTFNMQVALFDFGNNVPVIFEVRNLYQRKNHGAGKFRKGPGVGVIITMEDAEYRGGRNAGAFYDKKNNKISDHAGDGGKTHMQNFVDAVHNNDPGSLRANIENSFYSSCMSHLANISAMTGQDANASEVASNLANNDLASECFKRFSEQLDVWEVDTNKTPWKLGSELTFDGNAEQFTAGDTKDAANKLIRREDRKPFVVPTIG